MEIVWDWKSIGSLLATLVFLRSAARDFLPPELRHFLRSLFSRLYSSLRPSSSILIEEFDSTSSGGVNELFEASHSFLSSRCLDSAPVLRLSKPRQSKNLVSSLPASHSAEDSFQGVKLKWVFHSVDRPGSANSFFSSGRASGSERKYFELSFHRWHRDVVHSKYVPFVFEEAARIKAGARERRLYTNRSFAGSSIDDHNGHRLW